MGQLFEPYEPDQGLLLPPSLDDWLPEGHLAHFIRDTVDQLDLKPFFAKYEERDDGRGRIAFHPSMMLKVLIYSYCRGIFSSRKIAEAIDELVPLRYLAAGNRPSHRTIARFRLENLEHFESVFVQVVQIAQQAGLVKMGTIAIDGSKVKANASKHKAMSYGRMKEKEKVLRKEIRRMTELARTTDEAEDGEFGPDFRGDELPEEVQRRKDRLKTIKEAKKRLEEAQVQEDAESGRGEYHEQTGRGRKPERPKGVPEDKKQSNFTDPESRIMKTSLGFEQCYNSQIAVDSTEQIIVAANVGQCAADSRELIPTEEEAEKNTGQKPELVLADAGYKSEENFRALEKKKIKGLISMGKEGRSANPGKAGPASARMAAKLRTKHGRKRYKKRKAIVEPVFGWIKQVVGFRSFSLRSLAKVGAEWNLICLATNLRRMHGRMTWT